MHPNGNTSYPEAHAPNGVPETGEREACEPIAVVGFSLKFPGMASSVDGFWKMLVEGRSTMSEFPPDRISIDGHFNPDQSHLDEISARGGHFIEEKIDRFDAPFFSITPAEAGCMDPQQRGILETAYRALENAGITIEQCSGTRTSVHTGSFTDDYRSILFQDPLDGHTYAASGLSSSMLANRVSWFFNLKGPSINLDTACSSSLTALHLACEDLRNGTTNMGLAGGCNLLYHPDYMKIMSDMGFLSPDSRSWSLDEKANGYSRGEGIGIVILKRLSDAVRDGNTVRAVIRASSLSQDGRTPGITVPSGEAHKALIRETYAKARVDMEPTRFFEAHATGTRAGDPVEANAIGETFSQIRSAEDPLWVGAVKSNVGHLEAASGMAGLFKAILVLEKGIIPPNAGFQNLNKQIQAEKYHLAIPTEARPWPTRGLRRTCINSFGFGGSNVVIILDDAHHYPLSKGISVHHRTVVDPPSNVKVNGFSKLKDVEDIQEESQRGPGLLVWSSFDEDGLERTRAGLSTFFEKHTDDLGQEDIDDITYTLGTKRTQFTWRSFVVASDLPDLRKKLAQTQPKVRSASGRGIAFVFTGQGAQYAGMGQGLMNFSVFRESLESSQKLLNSMGCEWSLIDVMFSTAGKGRINEPQYSQPTCTALQIALVDLLASFNVKPTAVVGHSSGEIGAGYCIGALSQKDALKIAFHRGILAAKLQNGSGSSCKLTMMAAGLNFEEAREYVDKLKQNFDPVLVDIACVNSNKNVTLSGDETQLSFLEKQIQGDGKFARKLRVNTAYHSRFMEAIAEEYRACLQDLSEGMASPGPRPVMVSSVTGDFINPSELKGAEYWVKNMTSMVKFFDATSKLVTQSRRQRRVLGGIKQTFKVSDMLEIGPHHALLGPVRESVKSMNLENAIPYHSTLVRDSSSAENDLRNTAGKLFSLGYPVNIAAVNGLPNSPRTIRTDLPEYPFNHSQIHWRESRIGKNYRFRDIPRHDILGIRSSDWNPLQPRWRNFVSEARLPWLCDHKIADEFLYPAGGMIAMAIEAARQLASPTASSYELRDVQFLNPFPTFHQDDPVETQFSLCPLAQDPRWSEFHLFVYDERGCTEICRGQIRTHYDQENDDVASHLQRWNESAFSKKLDETRHRFSSQALYERFVKAYNAQYGPAFQTLENISVSATGQVMADLNTRKWAEAYGDKNVSPHVLHPCTLDGLFQSGFPMSDLKGGKKSFVPTKIQRLWVNARALLSLPSSTVQVMTECSSRGYRGTDVLSRVISADVDEPLIEMEHYETTMISSSGDSADDTAAVERKLCANIRWYPDIDLLAPEQLPGLVARPPVTQDEAGKTVQFYQDLHLMLRYFIFDTLSRVTSQDLTTSHAQNFVNWMKYQLRDGTFGLRDIEKEWLLNESYRRDQIEYIRNYNAEGKVLTVLGEKAYDIIRGEADPIQILFESTLAKDCYRETLSEGPYIPSLTKYLKLLGHKTPGMRILEIGAGTGSCTQPVTLALQEQGHPLWSQYDFTDISPGFFPEAQETFFEFSHSMKYRVFDAMADPLGQGLEEASYDLIVAGNVLHALKDLKTTLLNIRRLLKPGGKLVLFEITNPDALRAGLYGGVLKDWWNTIRDTERYTPLLSINSWDAILRETGFAGVDIAMKDHENPDLSEQTVLVSSVAPDPVSFPLDTRTFSIIADYSLPAQKELSDSLCAELASRGIAHKCTDIASISAEDAAETTCISLLEVGKPFLSSLEKEDFENLKRLAINCKEILWVSQDDQTPARPEYALIDGFGRVLRAEYPNHKLVKLGLEPTATRGLDDHKKTILGVLSQMLATDVQGTESEYSQHDGILNINRIVHSDDMNKMITERSAQRHTVTASLEDAPPLELRVESPGLLDSVRFHQTDEPLSPLEENEVLIRVQAIGLNHRDYQIASGQLNENELGMQCAGVVEEAGSTSGFSVGDRVCAVKLSASKTLIRGSASDVEKIPDFLSYSDAASLPSAAMLAVHCLIKVARLQAGETVLIQDAASTVGQAMVQIAQNTKARIFVTAKTSEQRETLHKEFDIPKEYIFSKLDASARNVILDSTNDEGIDTIILANDEEDMETPLNCLAHLGRLVRVNSRDPATSRSQQHHNTNVSLSHVNFADILRGRPTYVKKLLSEACEMIRNGQLRPPVGTRVYAPQDVEAAFRFFRSEEESGSAVIELVPGSTLTMTIATKPLYTFDGNSTYVIAGGLGGLGRSIARWMVERGARHLLLLSRNGATKPSGRELVDELSQRGVQLTTPACDVANLDELEKVMQKASRTMPPIRGCIQGTMVLRDSVFDNMSWDDWTTSTQPKVQGSWNLHRTLPKGMDFFLFLSSVSAIVGGLAQSNYASGNAYEDALCHYRNSIGEPASSVNLGVLVAEGIVAETEGLLSSLRGMGHFMEVSQAEMFALLERHLDHRNGADFVERQTVFGIQQPSYFLNNGRELPTHLTRPFFRYFHSMEANSNRDSTTTANHEDYGSVIAKAESLDQVGVHMTKWLVVKLSGVLGLVESDIDTSRPINSYGVDSLLGLEIRNWFERTLGANMPIFELLNNSSIAEVCRKAASRTTFRKDGLENGLENGS